MGASPYSLSDQELLEKLQTGDELAAQVLFDRYTLRLAALVRARLSRRLARRLDPEDVVLSAWRSFFVGARLGRWETGSDGDDLWPLLITLTRRKLARKAEYYGAQRRDLHSERGLDHTDAAAGSTQAGPAQCVPTPEQAATLLDEVEKLLAELEQFDRKVLVLRLQGASAADIAAKLGCSDRTIRRCTAEIRERLIGNEVFRETPLVDLSAAVQTIIETTDRRESVHESELLAPLAGEIEDLEVSYSELTLHQFAGQGGFGKVFRASWSRSAHPVAVKFLKKSFWEDRRAVRQLLNELAVVRQLQHAGVVPVRAWGRSPAGGSFLVMDWIEGKNAETWGRGDRPSLGKVVAVGATLARTLAAIHEQGIIHADLTPANVLVADDGRVLLTDFGMATALSGPGLRGVGGTAPFLAPEQVSELFGQVDPRTDVYGLGALLLSLLTGQPPIEGETEADVLAEIISSRPVAVRHRLSRAAPPLIMDLIERCLSKEPVKRPASMGEIAGVLDRVHSLVD